MTRAKRVQAAKLVQRSRANEDAFLSSLCIITKHEDEDTRKEIVDGFLRERRRGNTTRKYERFYYWWLAESYIFERNNSIAHESDGILNGGEYVRDGRIADYIP